MSPVSEPRKSLKRKSDTLKCSQSKDDLDDMPSKRKKSKSESGKVETPTDKGKSKKTTGNDEQTPVERPTRRSRTLAVTDSANKKTRQTSVPNKKESKGKNAIQKQTTSNTPTRSKNKVDQTEKMIAKKKTVPDASTKISDTRPPSNKRTRTSSQNVADVSENISSKTTPTNTSPLTPVVTPQPTTTNKRSTRQRLIASAPPTQKVTSRTSTKNTASPKAQKDKSPKLRSSLSNLDNSSNLNRPQHRTRRAIANEFKVNNVMTRNRSSTDGGNLLVKIKKLPMTRRKSSVGMDLSEKALSTGKSKKNVEKASSTPLRPRRLRSLEKK